MRHLFEKDVLAPVGNNNQGAIESYNESLYYDVIFPQKRNQSFPIVLRANIRGLYGKVDTSGLSIIPKEKYISQIRVGEDQQHRTLQLTEECFREMAEYYSKLDTRGKLSSKSVTLKEILPMKAWTSQVTSYSAHLEGIKMQFTNARDTDLPEIKDYNTFEKTFMEYAKSFRTPLTMSGYCASRLTSPLQTGLVIDLSDEDPSDDEAKHNGFIMDPNFNVYRSVANRFGFRIDAHIPWRLYLDLNSPYVQEKMRKRSVVSLKGFFEKYYHRTAEMEATSMNQVMYQIYDFYYKQDSTYMLATSCKGGTKTKISILEREIMTIEKLDRKYSINHWIRAYTYLRALETGRKWDQARFEKVSRNASEIYKYKGIERAISFLEPLFVDKTLELFSERDLTNFKSFDTILSDIENRATYKF
tara:strand:- start:39 stop:1286 length:1248 start_codon:yes stop_codon:yes gene_type:complete